MYQLHQEVKQEPPEQFQIRSLDRSVRRSDRRNNHIHLDHSKMVFQMSIYKTFHNCIQLWMTQILIHYSTIFTDSKHRRELPASWFFLLLFPIVCSQGKSLHKCGSKIMVLSMFITIGPVRGPDSTRNLLLPSLDLPWLASIFTVRSTVISVSAIDVHIVHPLEWVFKLVPTWWQYPSISISFESIGQSKLELKAPIWKPASATSHCIRRKSVSLLSFIG